MIKKELSELLNYIVKFVTNRLLLLFIAIVIMFNSLIVRLYDIQIINGFDYQSASENKVTYKDTAYIPAPRGGIYDRLGRPLAINEITFTIKIDPTIVKKVPASVAENFIKLMEKNGEKIIYDSRDFPFSDNEPPVFTLGSQEKEEKWKESMDVPKEIVTAQETFDYLMEFFGINKSIPYSEAKKILSLVSSVYLQRWLLGQITIAVNVKDKTIAAIEERNQDFPGFYVDVDYLRIYPRGENFSHMLGYIRGISSEEYAEKKDLGYKPTSIVGKGGLEKAFDLELRGKEGTMTVETDASGRRVSSAKISAPIKGDDVILTIDADLQDKASYLLQNMLKTILLNKLNGLAEPKEPAIKAETLLSSMINSNNISIEKIMASGPDTWSNRIKQYVDSNFATDKNNKNYDRLLKSFIAAEVENKNIPAGYVLLTMYEQGIITLTDENLIESLGKNNSRVLSTVIAKVEEGEITPQMANVEPVDGSAVVVDVNTGGVIAAASYPVYDNNELTNNFNNEYYNKLNNDPTVPMWYRAFSDPRAPGSTFKMITALTALETGAITKSTYFVDRGTFRDAGEPYANCWTHVAGYHGSVNVTRALEVSCNYFFYETMYRMGNTKSDTKLDGIRALNQYMKYFGLNDRAGVEISELYDSESMESIDLRISSPEFKAFKEKGRNSGLSDTDVRWIDGDSIRTAIGQSWNNYTAANMAKYIATIANGGNRYQLHLLDKTVSGASGEIAQFKPNIEFRVPLEEENLKLIYEGMYAVAQGTEGTARSVFADFPIKVGAKTGTAQEVGFSHASFAAYAPFENPQIAVYVVIPNGDTLTITAPAAQVARDIISAYFGFDSTPATKPVPNSLVK